MERKFLGKIKSAEYGRVSDRPFLMGLLLEFTFVDNGSRAYVSDGGKFTVNMSGECKWDNVEERRIVIEKQADAVYALLEEAGVDSVSKLKNKPVEITVEGGRFKDFRILSEVL